MADYVITKVRYNKAETHIDEVIVNDDGKSTTRVEQRATVVDNIKNKKKTYRTQPPSPTNGAPVRVVPANGVDYLRTDANATPRDNLENLPRF